MSYISCANRVALRPCAPACHPRSIHVTSRTIHYLTATDTVFSGIQPTGVPHLGNWLGTLKNWTKLQQSEARLFYAIADLHAITVPQQSDKLRQWRMEALAALVAIGLDPNKCTIFYQSAVSAHSELMWILSCLSSTGYLFRMTSWKSKSKMGDTAKAFRNPEGHKARLGLLAYPILQAADILIHRAKYVPVGADQAQHLEFARECARSFNMQYGHAVLEVPTAIYSPARRVMSLKDPQRKMSKSDPNDNSRILLNDTTDVIKRKIRASLTDSLDGITYSPEKRPGVANLLEILSSLEDGCPAPEMLAAEYSKHNMKGLKDHIANIVETNIRPIREAFIELTNDKGGQQRLNNIANEGAKTANTNATATMNEIRRVIGLN